MNIAIPISSYMWTGGAELIGNFTTAILSTYPDVKVFLLHNNKNKSTSKFVRVIYSATLVSKYGCVKTYNNIISILMGTDGFFSINDFIGQDQIFDSIRVINTDFSSKSLNSIQTKYNIDIIFASAYPIIKSYKGKWIGYITDLQHKHFKDNFTWMERLRRDFIFKLILNNADKTCVNSHSVKDDLVRSYGLKYCPKIEVLPFSPFPRKEWLLEKQSILDKYSLPSKYFIISSQLWSHKSHLTAFKALKVVSKKYKDIHIVCTGDTSDYRNPTFYTFIKESIENLGLSSKIKFLGLIPKTDQIQLLRKSIAVLQPSLFEGGPGGGAVQNAIALGVRSIITDIPINKEIDDDTISYFKAGSYKDLAEKMIRIIDSQYSIDQNAILKKGSDMKVLLGTEIIKLVKSI